MLSKLIYHEGRATARIFLPLYGAMLVLTALAKLFMTLAGMLPRDAASIFRLLSALASGFVGLGCTACVVAALFIGIQRFYRNLLGDEGYLMFTLPATPAQHIWAKLLVSTVWTLLAIALSALSAWALQGRTEAFRFYGTGENFAGGSRALLVVLVVLLLVQGIANLFLHADLSMALGGKWPQNRLIASIGIFVLIDIVLQIVGFVMLVSFAFTDLPGNLLAVLQGFATQHIAAMVLGAANALALAGNCIYFFVTRWLLTKKLNLA